MDIPATPRSASSSSAAAMIARSACSLRGRPRCARPRRRPATASGALAARPAADAHLPGLPARLPSPLPCTRRSSVCAEPRRPAEPVLPEYQQLLGRSRHLTSETNRSVFDCLKDIMPPSRMPERPRRPVPSPSVSSRSGSSRSTPPRASSARNRTAPSHLAPVWRRGALHRIRDTGLFPGRSAAGPNPDPDPVAVRRHTPTVSRLPSAPHSVDQARTDQPRLPRSPRHAPQPHRRPGPPLPRPHPPPRPEAPAPTHAPPRPHHRDPAPISCRSRRPSRLGPSRLGPSRLGPSSLRRRPRTPSGGRPCASRSSSSHRS